MKVPSTWRFLTPLSQTIQSAERLFLGPANQVAKNRAFLTKSAMIPLIKEAQVLSEKEEIAFTKCQVIWP